MVLRDGEHAVGKAVGDDVDGHLPARQELLNDHFASGITKDAFVHDAADRGTGLIRVLGDDDPLPGGEPVGLEDLWGRPYAHRCRPAPRRNR